jgi:hypothetical protein
MQHRKPTPASVARRRSCDALKDEVYRQMFRLEEGRTGADRELAIALVRAWMKMDVGPKTASDRMWLRKVSPVCIGLLEGMQHLSEPCTGLPGPG